MSIDMKQFFIAVSLASTLLASCQTVSNTTAVSDPVPYKAHGTEPFWSLSIASDRKSMLFARPGSDDIFSEFNAQSIAGGVRYISSTMTAEIRAGQCNDGMADRIYTDKVTVTMGDTIYNGCGGDIQPPKMLTATAWRIVSINGALIPADQGALISFDADRMSGSVGCNRLGASYHFENGTLSFGPMMSTRMACPDPIAAQEYGFVTMLGKLKSTAFAITGEMILTGEDGYNVVLEQST
jgi:heat shock protein HslJ